MKKTVKDVTYAMRISYEEKKQMEQVAARSGCKSIAQVVRKLMQEEAERQTRREEMREVMMGVLEEWNRRLVRVPYNPPANDPDIG